jgi:hypothetical protein
MIYLNTKLDALDKRDASRIARMTLKWCARTLGVNRRKKFEVKCYVSKGKAEDGICGEYDCYDNEIYIYYGLCADVRDIMATCIHEWTHHLQPIRSKYYKYPGTYSRNPYERQARYNEMKWTPIAWRELKNKVNKQNKTK